MSVLPLLAALSGALTVAALVLRLAHCRAAGGPHQGPLSADPRVPGTQRQDQSAGNLLRFWPRKPEGGIEFEGPEFELALLGISSALRAGKSVPQAIEHAAGQVTPPLSDDLAATALHAQGGDYEAALDHWHRRRGWPDIRALTAAVRIHRLSGGDLTPLLDRLAGDLRRSRIQRAQVRSKTAEARISALILGLSPPILTAYMALFRGDAVLLLLQEPVGRLITAYAAGSWLVGVLVIRKLLAGALGPAVHPTKIVDEVNS